MLKTENLTYWYNDRDQYLFKDVNLEFEAGHSYAIVGQSGSGKTTMVSLLAGLDTPKAGRILIDDQDIKKHGLTNYRQSQVAIVFQAYNLFTYMSALENLMTAMAITKAKHKGDKAYAKGMLTKLGLTDEQMTKNVQKLSGGQQQRVAIARTMVCDAPLVVADEPTGNLDEDNTTEVIALFNQIAHEAGKCVIIVTHEPTVAAQCDGVLRLAHRTFTWEKQPQPAVPA
ncbi:ABC transporter ATP-binding protein [Lacticaseibacillus suihuaensis]